MRWTILIPALLSIPGLRAQASVKTVNELKAFFSVNCVKCHGPDGSARGAEGEKPGGFDFTDAKKAAKETDAEMAKTIRKGLFFGIKMPSFKEQLTEVDALLMVKEVIRKAEKGKVNASA